MPSLSVGIYCEATDWMILKAFVCRTLQKKPSGIEVIETPSKGGSFATFAGALPTFLHKYYKQCVSLVVVCTDNDGKIDLTRPGAPSEDPKHPRHARHAGQRLEACRHCVLEEKVKDARPALRYLPPKDGMHWPIVVTVPVEAIESWLLTARALVTQGDKYMRAEDLPGGSRLKTAFYGRPFVTTPDVISKALPVINDPALDLSDLAAYSPSFRLFVESLQAADLS